MALRPFFLEKGYDLYIKTDYYGPRPRLKGDPNPDGFRHHGVRSNFEDTPILWCPVRDNSCFIYTLLKQATRRELRFGVLAIRK